MEADNAGDNTLDETFTYDDNGNLLTRPNSKQFGLTGSFTYPLQTAARPHAPTALGATSLSYDANGNMTADGSRLLQWDEPFPLLARLVLLRPGATSISVVRLA